MDCDVDAAELVCNSLRQRNIEASVITDEEFIRSYRSNGYFIISIGGPKVNRITRRVQEIYQRALDVSQYDICWAYGSKGTGVKSNAYHLNSPCIAIFGPQQNDTLHSIESFIYDGLLDRIIEEPKSWQGKLVESR
ncbi:MAG: hypothetical protein HF312_02630 [Ignavibacteria bacterium]|jgi:hypothetical protein|nr:hypothetical protein [Ignavibacteria bacterium]